MTLEHVMILCLSILNAVQLLFWTWQIHKLVNKLMCRDFAEYKAVKRGPGPVGVPYVDETSVIQEQEILNELNGMIA